DTVGFGRTRVSHELTGLAARASCALARVGRCAEAARRTAHACDIAGRAAFRLHEGAWGALLPSLAGQYVEVGAKLPIRARGAHPIVQSIPEFFDIRSRQALRVLGTWR